MANSIHVLDYTVIVLYLIGIFYLAARSGRKTGNTLSAQDQYLAGKSLTIPESLSSIIATEVSALTFLGIPAIAFGKDYSFIQIYFGAIVGRIIIAYIMLPRVYDQGLTIYTVMGKFGTKAGQKSIAIFYSLNKFLAVGVRLFSGSILVAEFFSVNIFIAVAIICLITFFYTLIGGLKAVVRTDMVQMGLFIIGGIVAHFLIPEIAGKPWGELMGMAQAASKTSFYDFSNPAPFIIGVLGGIVFDMATHGVDQDFVQRLTANKSLKGAQFSIICSSVVSIFVGLLFLGIGSLLWSYYQLNTAPELGADKIFAYFITQHFPIGLKGLMVAGVLAATMSTLDSSINALSACFHNDIRSKPNDKNKSADISFIYRKDTLMITCILMLIAFIASGSDGLLLFGLKITSWTAGSLLACFFATVVFKFGKLTPVNVISAYALGAAGVYANTFHLQLNWNWNVYFGFILGSLAFYLSDKITRKQTKKMRT
jgi:SSS family solute:Na+ symporter